MALTEIIPWRSRRRSLTRRDDPFIDFQQQFNRAFEELFGGAHGLPSTERVFLPPVEIIDTDDELRIRAELPGIDPTDLDLDATDDALTIRGEKRHERSVEERGVHWTERSFGSFERVIPLPAEVNPELVKADLKNGILEIRLPKREGARTRSHKVQIN